MSAHRDTPFMKRRLAAHNKFAKSIKVEIGNLLTGKPSVPSLSLEEGAKHRRLLRDFPDSEPVPHGAVRIGPFVAISRAEHSELSPEARQLVLQAQQAADHAEGSPLRVRSETVTSRPRSASPLPSGRSR